MSHLDVGHTDPRIVAKHDREIAAARIVGKVQGLLTTHAIDAPDITIAELREFIADYEDAERRLFALLVDRQRCPHGNIAGDCNECDVASDFAYDAAREDRMFPR